MPSATLRIEPTQRLITFVPFPMAVLADYLDLEAENTEPVHFPLILGQDTAGIVTQVGPSVTRFTAGEAVYDDSGV
jgi:hypothetical protein